VSFPSLRADFPVCEHTIWLNNCGISPAGSFAVERMRTHFETLLREGPLGEGTSPGRLRRSIAEKLGALLEVTPDELALIHNTAEGMTMLSLGLELSPGDRILLLENEYPSNVYPWQFWDSRGVVLDFVPQGRSPAEFLASLERSLTPRTRVVALSAVHWCTGMVYPLRELAELCHARGVLLVLDGSQGVGHIPLSLAALRPAALVFSAWKWLLGPLGLGVLCVSRELLPKLRSVFRGPDGMAQPSYLPYQTEVSPRADRYTYSTANYNDWAYFDASLDYLSKLGFENVFARISALGERLHQGLSSLGFVPAYDRSSAPPSGIVSMKHPAADSAALVTALGERGIVARERLGYLRLAPHVYLDERDIERTVATLASLLRAGA